MEQLREVVNLLLDDGLVRGCKLHWPAGAVIRQGPSVPICLFQKQVSPAPYHYESLRNTSSMPRGDHAEQLVRDVILADPV